VDIGDDERRKEEHATSVPLLSEENRKLLLPSPFQNSFQWRMRPEENVAHNGDEDSEDNDDDDDVSSNGESIDIMVSIRSELNNYDRGTVHAASEYSNRLMALFLPIATSNLLYFAISLINMSFVGHVNDMALATSVLATTLFNATGFAVLQGFTSALETLCGNAFGAGHYQSVGIILQKGLVLNGILSACIIGAWGTCTKPIFSLLGQDEELSVAASRYIMLMSPALPLNALYESLKRYLSCQGIVRPMALSTGITCCLCPLYNYLLIYYFDLGVDGAALVSVCISFTMALMLLIMTIVIEWCKPLPRTWGGFSAAHVFSSDGYAEFLKIAVPGCVMILSEWSAFEAITILSGLLPHAKVHMASMGIMMNISGFVWTIVNGFSFSASVLIAQSLGAGFARDARAFAVSAVRFGFLFEVCTAVVLLLSRNKVGGLFSNSEHVVDCISVAMPLFALSLPGDGVNCCLQGVLRGSGRLVTGAVVNIIMYWLIGIPTAAFLAFKAQYHMNGLWGGVAIVNTLIGLVMGIVFYRIDFKHEATRAVARNTATVSANNNNV